LLLEHRAELIEDLPRHPADSLLLGRWLPLVCDDPELLRRHAPELRRRKPPSADDDPIDELYESGAVDSAVSAFFSWSSSTSPSAGSDDSAGVSDRSSPRSRIRSCRSSM